MRQPCTLARQKARKGQRDPLRNKSILMSNKRSFYEITDSVNRVDVPMALQKSEWKRRRRLFDDLTADDRKAIDASADDDDNDDQDWMNVAQKVDKTSVNRSEPIDRRVRHCRPHVIDDRQAERFFVDAIDWSARNNTSIWFACLPCSQYNSGDQRSLDTLRLRAALARHLFERELDCPQSAPCRLSVPQRLLASLSVSLLDVNSRHPISGLTPFSVTLAPPFFGLGAGSR